MTAPEEDYALRLEARVAVLEAACQRIEDIAPPCSEEAETLTTQDWRDRLRSAQSIARLARKGVTRTGGAA